MIYCVFMKKEAKNTVAPPIVGVVSAFIGAFARNDVMISLPGYMGRNRKTIQNFISTLQFGKNTYFTVGMNGTQPIANANISIQNEHNSYFNTLPATITHYTDHSKMMFFLDVAEPNATEEEALRSLELLLAMGETANIPIKAVLIGSSNQSYDTYVKIGSSKGEADILLIDGEYIDANDEDAEKAIVKMYEELPQEVKDRTILSKELAGNGRLLTEIFKKTLNVR